MRYLLFILLMFNTIAFAAIDDSSIKFFYSNNVKEIDVEEAYARLVGHPQQTLQENALQLLQYNHVEQGQFNNILGTYQMMNDHQMTGDNSEIFYASPLQYFSDNQVFSLAAKFANTLHQESVAVFIPEKQADIGDVTVTFKSHYPTINEAIEMIRSKCPSDYNNAYSLFITNKQSNFATAEVRKIEWIGRRMNTDVVKNAFPQETVASLHGRAYLVFQNGQVNPL